MLPRKGLREAGITQMRGGFTNVASIRNLTAPTLPVYPPTGDRFHWRVLSHLAPNYLSLLDAEVLRGTLALYDWTDGETNRQRIDAITEVRHRPCKNWRAAGCCAAWRSRSGWTARALPAQATSNCSARC